eukprot:scaffold45555_cov52-Attheya_sp.AAC.6
MFGRVGVRSVRRILLDNCRPGNILAFPPAHDAWILQPPMHHYQIVVGQLAEAERQFVCSHAPATPPQSGAVDDHDGTGAVFIVAVFHRSNIGEARLFQGTPRGDVGGKGTSGCLGPIGMSGEHNVRGERTNHR